MHRDMDVKHSVCGKTLRQRVACEAERVDMAAKLVYRRVPLRWIFVCPGRGVFFSQSRIQRLQQVRSLLLGFTGFVGKRFARMFSDAYGIVTEISGEIGMGIYAMNGKPARYRTGR